MTELENAPAEPAAPEVLAVDVGGSHVKMLVNGDSERRRFVSGPDLTPGEMVKGVLDLAGGSEYGYVSVGVPAAVLAHRVVHEPVNLGPGWVGFDFEAAFGKPTKVLNDAAMQAFGSYTGGRMLFLGLSSPRTSASGTTRTPSSAASGSGCRGSHEPSSADRVARREYGQREEARRRSSS